MRYELSDWYQLSLTNQKPENQDFCGHLSDEPFGDPQRSIHIFYLGDGVSRGNGGQAAAVFPGAIRRQMLALLERLAGIADDEPQEMLQAIVQAIGSCFQAVDQLGRSHRQPDEPFAMPCRSTLSLAVVFQDQLITANIGDSPIFYFQNYGNQQLLPLYVLQNCFGANQRRPGSFDYPDHVAKSRLTQSVGAPRGQELNWWLYDQVEDSWFVQEPECGSFCLTPLENYCSSRQLSPSEFRETLLQQAVLIQIHPIGQSGTLLLGSDGSLGVFQDRELEDYLNSARLDGLSTQQLVRSLCRSAAGRTNDNITLIAANLCKVLPQDFGSQWNGG